MEYEIQKDEKFNYLEVGEGETLMLLHGLFGALSNFSGLIEKFRHTHKVVVPIMPLFDMDLLHTSVTGLAKYVEQFVEARGYQNIHLLGNSLGGHVGLVYILKHPEKIKSPGSIAAVGIRVSPEYCVRDVRGIPKPATSHAHEVKPEQSKALPGDFAPNR